MRCSSSQFLKPGFDDRFDRPDRPQNVGHTVVGDSGDRDDRSDCHRKDRPGSISDDSGDRRDQIFFLMELSRTIGAILAPRVLAVNVTILVKMYSKWRRTTSSLLNYSRRKSRYTIVYTTNSARSMGKYERINC